MKFFILTFGCKVNQYESRAITENFYKFGFVKADTWENSDIIILNSCTVTDQSDKKVLKILNRIRKNNVNAIIVLTGCIPQAFPEKTKKLFDADIIIGNSDKNNLLPIIMNYMANRNKIININEYNKNLMFESSSIKNFEGRTRAFIKIEDGCNRFCSYCIIPYARGRVRSKPIKDILNEVTDLAKNGYKEIVLVGINLTSYGSEIGLNICDAVDVVCSVSEIERVRLSSMEPDQIDEKTIKRLSKQDKLCPHFHLSLQSGCDKTLKHMNRHYTTSEYMKIVENLREHFKNASITTDVMVGFAGETNEDFQKSLEFVSKIGFSKVHVFPYSIREGTKAATFNNQVDNVTKKLRSKIMIAETNKSRLEFLKSQIGLIEPVLFENQDKDGYFSGYTKNYTPVKLKTNQDLHSKVLMTKITDIQNDCCIGMLIT